MELKGALSRFKSILWLDWETRSEADLIKEGAHRYAEHNTTEITLLTYAFDNEPFETCEKVPDHVWDALEDDDILKVAHNAEFDMAITQYVLGIPVNPYSWFDTAYMAAYFGYPRKLAKLTRVLGTTQKASNEEMLLFAVPLVRAQPSPEHVLFDISVKTRWANKYTHPREWYSFVMYAETDGIAMREAAHVMGQLPDFEVFVMQFTFQMNFQGVPFDKELALRIWRMAKDYERRAGEEAMRTYGVKNLRSGPEVMAALEKNGLYLQSLNKNKRVGVTHPLLELRDQASASAFSKIPTAFFRVCSDLKIRGEFLGYGAHTGRYSSRGVQLQNLARILERVSESLEGVKSYSHLRQHMRLCFGYEKGRKLTVGDLSQIEARITAWLANCKWRIDAFRNGEDIYARSAEKMFGIDHVTKDMIERMYGKMAELGFGFGGGVGALFNINPDFVREKGEEKIQAIVDRWRTANPEICALWRRVEDAFREAMRSGLCRLNLNGCRLVFQSDGNSVRIVLPAGRALYYRNVSEIKGSLHYTNYEKGGDFGVQTKFWGGTLLENLAQSIARDVLIEIMKSIEGMGLDSKCIGTVHDELWYSHPEDVPMLDILLSEMSRPIEWAPGLITKGDGFTSDRYRK